MCFESIKKFFGCNCGKKKIAKAPKKKRRKRR